MDNNNGWRDVRKELPVKDGVYLCCSIHGEFDVIEWLYNDWYGMKWGRNAMLAWCLLPDPPAFD